MGYMAANHLRLMVIFSDRDRRTSYFMAHIQKLNSERKIVGGRVTTILGITRNDNVII